MFLKKKYEYVCLVTGLNPEADNTEFIIGKITGIIMGITNFRRQESLFVIGQKPNGDYKIEFNATQREAEKIGSVVDGSLPLNKGIKVTIVNCIED